MKKFLVLLSILCFGAYADTINLHWLNDDGSIYENSTCTVDGDLELPTPPTKYGYTFTGWEFQVIKELEYLSFGGTYIDSGIMFDSDEIEYETKFKINHNYRAVFGAEGTCSGNSVFTDSAGGIRIVNGMSYPSFLIGNTTLCCANNSTPVNVYNLYIKKSTNIAVINVNGSLLSQSTFTGNITSDKNIWIGGAGQGEYCFFSGDIYYFKIKKNGILIRDFIPVLDNNDVPCMFDKVEGKFYYNQGTGQFVAGPVLTE